MSAKLASDLDNKDYAGATNPDSRLAVRFYKEAVQNNFETEKQGRPIYQDVDFVEIMVPGDNTTIVTSAVREDHKRRFPLHWAHYMNTNGGDTKEMGTPLSQWPRLSPAQVEEYRALKFYTVEAIATASDAQLQRMGMGAMALRDHAVRFLKIAHEDSIAKDAEDKLKAIRESAAAEKAEMQQQMDEMRAQIAALAPKKRGRKPKEVPTE